MSKTQAGLFIFLSTSLLTSLCSAVFCRTNPCVYVPDTRRLECASLLLNCIPNVNRRLLLTIDLKNNALTHLTSRSFINYPNLQQLDLSSNQISSINPGGFSGLNKLKILWLSFNRITSLTSKVFQAMPNLEVLHLEGNAIVTISADAFAGLTRLKEINLNANRLQNLPENVFHSVPNLVRLSLSENVLNLPTTSRVFTSLLSLADLEVEGNRFTSIPNINGMRSLSDLDLTDNQITVIRNNTFSTNVRLRELKFGRNRIASIQSNAFTGIAGLLELDLGFNLLTYLPEQSISHMILLERLLLNNNQLPSISNDLSSMTKLQVLRLDSNVLRELPSLRGNTAMTSIGLRTNKLTTFDSANIASMPQLTRIDLRNNLLNCDCRLQSLRHFYISQAVPGFEVPICTSPMALHGRKLTSVLDSQLVCNKPKVVVTQPVVTVALGQPAILHCHGSGNPMPIITWRLHDRFRSLVTRQTKSVKYSVSQFGSLHIAKTVPTDAGSYMCRGTNPAGEAQTEVRLQLRAPPPKGTTAKPTLITAAPRPTIKIESHDVPGVHITPFDNGIVTWQDRTKLLNFPNIPEFDIPISTKRPDIPIGDNNNSSNPMDSCQLSSAPIVASVVVTFFLTAIMCTILILFFYKQIRYFLRKYTPLRNYSSQIGVRFNSTGSRDHNSHLPSFEQTSEVLQGAYAVRTTPGQDEAYHSGSCSSRESIDSKQSNRYILSDTLPSSTSTRYLSYEDTHVSHSLNSYYRRPHGHNLYQNYRIAEEDPNYASLFHPPGGPPERASQAFGGRTYMALR
ncbi:leucine-rich repeat and immunoglobulin-like domain-containing nogo receptor-interacting protein 2 [Anneissia japonica]|uniref:leucine-rich repeat and immunoglobulin-like domain-containing nogo receptor-interacting protein 2 n=1 Tax=Anneissia japonica TaxID=1529436 RepID=UPI0014254B8C|nr:leucine-rich repeat and immunoglobulin-like domain-containing nogo receptor-interacting protein 2 [Anneissia japonica]